MLINTIEKEFAELSSFSTNRMGRAFARARPNKTLSAPTTRSRGNSEAGSSRRYGSPGMQSRTSRSGSNDSTTNSVAAGIASATPPRTDQDGDAIDRATISSDSLYNASSPPLSPAERKSNGAGVVQASIYDTPLNEQVLEFNGEDGEEEKEEELPGYYTVLLSVVGLSVVICVICVIIQADKEPCHPFYVETSPVYGCSNTNTIGLFIDDWHRENCHELHNRSEHMAAYVDPEVLYYPHPPLNPTGCVLVRKARTIKCLMGPESSTACLC